MFYSPAFTFSSIDPLGFCRVPGFALGCCASFRLFWPLALVQQALPAIILQALRRLRGAVLFRGLRSSSSWVSPFWRLGLTVQSSRPAFGCRLSLFVSHIYGIHFFEWRARRGSAAPRSVNHRKEFAGGSPVVTHQFQALRRFRDAVLFRSVRPSSIQWFLFWLLGLTVQSSRPAFGGRLTFGVSPFIFRFYAGQHLFQRFANLKGFSFEVLALCRASPAFAALVSSLFGL